MKLLIAVALGVGIVIGFGMAVTLDTPKLNWARSSSSREIRCVPFAPDSAALARKHRFPKRPVV